MLRAWSLSLVDIILLYSLCDTGQVNLHDGHFAHLYDQTNNTSLIGLSDEPGHVKSQISQNSLSCEWSKSLIAHITENSWVRSVFRVYLIHNSLWPFFPVNFFHLWLFLCWLHSQTNYSFLITIQQKLKHDIFLGSNFRGKSKNNSL